MKRAGLHARELVALLEMGNIATAAATRMALIWRNVLLDGDLIAFWYRFLKFDHQDINHIRKVLKNGLQILGAHAHNTLWDDVAAEWLERYTLDNLFKLPRATQLKQFITYIKEAEVRPLSMLCLVPLTRLCASVCTAGQKRAGPSGASAQEAEGAWSLRSRHELSNQRRVRLDTCTACPTAAG